MIILKNRGGGHSFLFAHEEEFERWKMFEKKLKDLEFHFWYGYRKPGWQS